MELLPNRIVGKVPDYFFSNLNEAINDFESFNVNPLIIGWPMTRSTQPFERPVIDVLSPILNVISKAETQRIRFIQFSINVGLVLPDCYQGTPNEIKWHREGNIRDNVSRYVTSNELPLEIKYTLKDPTPGEVNKFRRAKLRLPINKTEYPINRTSVKANVFHS